MSEHYACRAEGDVGDPVSSYNRMQGDGTLTPLQPGEFNHEAAETEDRTTWVLGADGESVDIRDPRDTAMAEKTQELHERWVVAVRNGIPVTINGVSALLRYTERDERRWQLWVPGLSAPTGGLLVALEEPLNGKLCLRIQGVPKLTAGKQGILNHINQADTAWETGTADLDALYTGEATAEQIGAYDVEALDWPANSVP